MPRRVVNTSGCGTAPPPRSLRSRRGRSDHLQSIARARTRSSSGAGGRTVPAPSRCDAPRNAQRADDRPTLYSSAPRADRAHDRGVTRRRAGADDKRPTLYRNQARHGRGPLFLGVRSRYSILDAIDNPATHRSGLLKRWSQHSRGWDPGGIGQLGAPGWSAGGATKSCAAAAKQYDYCVIDAGSRSTVPSQRSTGDDVPDGQTDVRRCAMSAPARTGVRTRASSIACG